MKLLDIESNESIDIISFNLKREIVNQKYKNTRTYLTPMSNERCSIVLVIPDYEIQFIENWQSKTYCSKSGMRGLKKDYAKTIYVMYNDLYTRAKLYGSYPTDIEVDISNKTITVNLSVDYYDEMILDDNEIRDIKIDQILN